MTYIGHLRAWLCLVIAFALPLPVSAQTGRDQPARIALVIGNNAYGSVTALDNPVNDADLIARTLQSLRFDVTLVTDATQISMKRAIAQFGRELRDAGPDAVGLFYYAGHALQSFGTNYLLPVDASLLDAADLDLVAVEAQSVLRQMHSARNATNILILDACRNNPFTDIPEFNDNGLAEMDAPTGTFLAYATAPGDVALDGLTGNSPFTRSLAGYISTPGMPVEQMFKKVRIEVLDETDGAQTPWDSSSLTRDFMFAEPEDGIAATDRNEELDWRAAQATGDMLDLIAYLQRYPQSVHATAARDLLVAVMEADLGVELKSPGQDGGNADAPSATEERVFRTASALKTRGALQLYLRLYPQGHFSDLARLEIAAIEQPDTRGQGESQGSDNGLPPVPDDLVTFISPLSSEVPEVNGRSIAVLMNSVPLFPPVEDLPDEFWKGQSCGSCHKWSEDRLCDHATRYLGPAAAYAAKKKHPFGGDLKKNLRFWAAGGCQ